MISPSTHKYKCAYTQTCVQRQKIKIHKHLSQRSHVVHLLRFQQISRWVPCTHCGHQGGFGEAIYSEEITVDSKRIWEYIFSQQAQPRKLPEERRPGVNLRDMLNGASQKRLGLI